MMAAVNKAQDEFLKYVLRIRQFNVQDWLVYVVWVGMLFSLFGAVTAFVVFGYRNGVQFPSYVWNIPLGAFVFATAVSIDTIGHRTIYKSALKDGEDLVHHITIFCGIASVILLCLCYENPIFFRVPALVLTAFSFVYSMVDEVFHWRRYVSGNSDPVEMWSHFGILFGHTVMMAAWCWWFLAGYSGVSETLSFL